MRAKDVVPISILDAAKFAGMRAVPLLDLFSRNISVVVSDMEDILKRKRGSEIEPQQIYYAGVKGLVALALAIPADLFTSGVWSATSTI